jgi:hypothetical protein
MPKRIGNRVQDFEIGDEVCGMNDWSADGPLRSSVLRCPRILALCVQWNSSEMKGTQAQGGCLDDALAAFNPTERINGKTIIRVHP